MTPEERFERIEANLDETNRIVREMAARQQYHDEAFDRMDAGMRRLQEAGERNERPIQSLSNLFLLHADRLENHAGRLNKLDNQGDDSGEGTGTTS